MRKSCTIKRSSIRLLIHKKRIQSFWNPTFFRKHWWRRWLIVGERSKTRLKMCLYCGQAFYWARKVARTTAVESPPWNESPRLPGLRGVLLTNSLKHGSNLLVTSTAINTERISQRSNARLHAPLKAKQRTSWLASYDEVPVNRAMRLRLKIRVFGTVRQNLDQKTPHPTPCWLYSAAF